MFYDSMNTMYTFSLILNGRGQRKGNARYDRYLLEYKVENVIMPIEQQYPHETINATFVLNHYVCPESLLPIVFKCAST